MKKTMKRTKWWLPALILLTAFQLISMAQVVFNDDGSLSTECLIFFGAYLAVEWVYFIAMSIARKRADPALEMIAFFLTGIGLVTVAGANKDLVKTQFVADMLGIFCFVALLWLISNVDRAMVMRTPMAVAAIGLLVLTPRAQYKGRVQLAEYRRNVHPAFRVRQGRVRLCRRGDSR
jgi:hypothetical protein